MRRTVIHTIVISVILVICQGIIDGYLDLSHYLILSCLPFIILSLPFKIGTPAVMLIAFFVGLGADFLGGGILGINAGALTGAAFLRKGMMSASINAEIYEKEPRPTPGITGYQKFSLFSLLFTTAYLVFYILLDSAGVAPLLFNMTRLAISIVADVLLSAALFFICNHGERGHE